MIIGKIVLDILHDKKNIAFNSDEIRKFNIGLLSIGTSKLPCIRKFLCNFFIPNPFLLGYRLQKFINKKASSNLEKLLSNSQRNCTDLMFQNKYELILPEITPYFSLPRCFDLNDYLEVQHKYKESKIDKNKCDDAEKLEKEFVSMANKFCNKKFLRVRKISKTDVKLRKKISWSAENTKNTYYKERWNLICQQAYNGNSDEIHNLDIFFNGLMEELDNIRAYSNKACIGWKRDEKRIIIASVLVTFLMLLLLVLTRLMMKIPFIFVYVQQ